MRRFASLLSLALISTWAGPSAAAHTPEQIERLAALGRVWGYATYLHPRLHDAEAAANWDRAFVAAVPRALDAKDDAAYTVVVDELLATIGDRVAPATPTAEPTFAEPERHEVDGVLVVDLRDPTKAPDYFQVATQWAPLAEDVAGAKAVVFDLRAEKPAGTSGEYLGYAFASSGVGHALECIGLPGLSVRSRAYAGFTPETGGSSGGYVRYFETTSPARVTAFREAPKPKATGHPFAVFVVNRNSVVPDCAIALELAGKAEIVGTESGRPAGLPSMEIALPGGQVARIRTGEALEPSGDPWWGQTRLVGDPLEAAVAAARHGNARRSHGPRLSKPLAPDPPAPEYPTDALPEAAWRALAVAKTYVVIDLFFPYRDLMTDDWDVAYRTALRGALEAADADAYRVALARFVAATGDSHVGLRGAAVPALFARDAPPFLLRFVEGRPIVDRLLEQAPKNVRVGDEVVAVDGRPVAERIGQLRGLLTASTPQWGDLLVARYLLAGPADSAARVTLDGADGRRDVVARRLPIAAFMQVTERDGPVFRMLDGNVGYADLARLSPEEVPKMFELFAKADAIVFDMRGYPRGTAWSIAPRLTDRARVAAARFDRKDVRASQFFPGDLGAMHTTTTFTQFVPDPVAPTWRGRTVMLIDERALSQAEHTGLFLRAASGTKFVGTPTGGANGDVTNFGAPGGIMITFTGQSVRWPNGDALQRRGLQPDVEVAPTIAGIRAGKDEVLERALETLQTR